MRGPNADASDKGDATRGLAMKTALEPIMPEAVGEVGDFLHRSMGERVSRDSWIQAMNVPWSADAPNHGYLLRAGGDVVGAHLAYYSRREIRGQVLDICNLGAWSVDPDYRLSGLRLLKALLAQDNYHFTDLSPSGNVVPINERLDFSYLDTTTALTLNTSPVPSRAAVSSEPEAVEAYLSEEDHRIYLDHRDTAAARHAVLLHGSRSCYIMFRHDRRKGLSLFVSILHVSDPDLLHRHFGAFSRFALRQHGAVATLSELRVVRRRPPLSKLIPRPRPKMFRSSVLTAHDVDYLYSELECLEW
jgi:hypothetical protein